MYEGDRSRKTVLVNYGFRLPSALDNRPLNFDEFMKMTNQIIYVSATPAEFEIQNSVVGNKGYIPHRRQRIGEEELVPFVLPEENAPNRRTAGPIATSNSAQASHPRMSRRKNLMCTRRARRSSSSRSFDRPDFSIRKSRSSRLRIRSTKRLSFAVNAWKKASAFW